MTDQQMAHLGMVQGIINRMAGNSFSLKALAVTIAAALVALTGVQQSESNLILVAGLLPVFVFWIMDAQYLRLERLYRELYDHIRLGGEIEPFSMNTKQFQNKVESLPRIAISWSVLWFYTAISIVLIVLIFRNCFQN